MPELVIVQFMQTLSTSLEAIQTEMCVFLPLYVRHSPASACACIYYRRTRLGENYSPPPPPPPPPPHRNVLNCHFRAKKQINIRAKLLDYCGKRWREYFRTRALSPQTKLAPTPVRLIVHVLNPAPRSNPASGMYDQN